MSNGITGFDHTLIGVRDLEFARETYARLGFTLTPRGSHIGWGTANYCIMFESDYVELLGVVDPSAFTNGLDKQLATRGEGLLALALATDDAHAAEGALKAAGLGPSPVQDLARNLELPSGTVLPAFRLVHLPPESTPEMKLFLCQHLTPELLRQPAWLRHANGARTLQSVTVVVEDPHALRAPYGKLFGNLNLTTTDDTLTVFTGHGTIIFVTPDDLELHFPALDMTDAPASPYMAAMTIVVEDTGATAACLERSGVEFIRMEGGDVRVDRDQACGVVIEFTRHIPKTAAF